MSLNTILNKIETYRPTATTEIDMSNPGTYQSRVGVKRAAKEAIERLEKEYEDELRNSTVFIVVTGKERDTFTQVASGKEFGCFSVDPDSLFKDLTDTIDKSLFGREGVRYLFNIASNALQDKARDLGIRSYNMLQFSDKYNSGVKTPEEFIPILRRAVVDQVGSEIVGLDAIKKIVTPAINNKHGASVTVVVLNTADENFAVELQSNLKKHRDRTGEGRGLTDKVFLVGAGKTSQALHQAGALLVKKVTEETVGEALTTLRNKVQQ